MHVAACLVTRHPGCCAVSLVHCPVTECWVGSTSLPSFLVDILHAIGNLQAGAPLKQDWAQLWLESQGSWGMGVFFWTLLLILLAFCSGLLHSLLQAASCLQVGTCAGNTAGLAVCVCNQFRHGSPSPGWTRGYLSQLTAVTELIGPCSMDSSGTSWLLCCGVRLCSPWAVLCHGLG